MLPSPPSTISPSSSHSETFTFAPPAAAATHSCTRKQYYICEAARGLCGYKDKETACKNPIYYCRHWVVLRIQTWSSHLYIKALYELTRNCKIVSDSLWGDQGLFMVLVVWGQKCFSNVIGVVCCVGRRTICWFKSGRKFLHLLQFGEKAFSWTWLYNQTDKRDRNY